MAKNPPLLEEAFALLKESELLQGKAAMDQSLLDQPAWKILFDASSKMFEACYLMKRHVIQVNKTSASDTKTLQLLQAKINDYEVAADKLRKKVETLKHTARGQTQSANNSATSTATTTAYNKKGSMASFEESHLHSVDNHTQNLPIKPPQTIKLENSKDRTENNYATRIAGQATTMLSTAIDQDENENFSDAIEKYVKAAELYLKAVKLLSETDNGSTKQRSGIDTSETASYSAESHNLELVTSWKKRIKDTLDRVEKLKLKEEGSTSNTAKDVEKSKSNQQKSKLTNYELDVLVRSSLLTSGIFLPWSDEKVKKYNFSPTQKFVDPEGALKLSQKQKLKFHKWARPSEIIAMCSCSTQQKTIKMIHTISPYTIKQYCVSDCSFIAGLCISAAYERRLKRQLVSSLIYPQDSNGMPIYNPKGIYMVKLWLNGVARRVIVDDYLPVDKNGNLLCSHTIAIGGNKGNILELWVPILEKAYLKLCGGYDFSGSNSGVDMFCLTGWIPERVFFPKDNNNIQDFETPIERCWEKIYSASSYNDALITMATKDLTEEEANKVGIFVNHAYAVLRIIQTSNGSRLLQLKNPWGRSGWNGKYSSQDKSTWADVNLRREVGYDADTASNCDDGVFWISWSDVTIYFRNIQISWNPELFSCKKVAHALWNSDVGPIDDSFNVSENPQYIVTLSKEALQKKATLWILLSRHVTKQEQEGSEVEDFLAAHIHRIHKPKQRVFYPDGDDCIVKGAYTNSQHSLIRYDADGLQDKLSIVLSQFKKSNDIGFTLSCFCTEQFYLGQPEMEMAVYQTLRGKWELRCGTTSNAHSLQIGTAGGPIGKGSWGSNPQWSINVPKEDTKLQLKCAAMKELAINVVLVRTTRRRVHHLYEEPIIDTGSYRHGFCMSEITTVPVGMYNVVASTYRAGEVGSFVLSVLSSSTEIEICEIM